MNRLVIGLTGGIGVGKSTVASLLGQWGAEVIDVDLLGRQVLEPTGGAYHAVIATFGQSIVAADGTIDRAVLATEVFGGANRLAELEAISHPAINARLEALLEAAPQGRSVVFDLAVLAESRLGWRDGAPMYQRVIVVEAPMELRIPRLIKRGMSEEQARARMAAQVSDEQRRALADLVIGNDGDLAQLERRVDDLYATLDAWALQALTR